MQAAAIQAHCHNHTRPLAQVNDVPDPMRAGRIDERIVLDCSTA